MYLAFVDDSTQNPTRPGFKGQLISVGALCLPADQAKAAERALANACDEFGFPPGEEFKWSPNRGSWMRTELVEDARTAFYKSVAQCLVEANAFATIVMEDDGRNPATEALTCEEDVIVLLFERVSNRLKELGEAAFLVADRPGGDRKEENNFVVDCLAVLETGTKYVDLEEIPFVVTADSRFIRLLQAADLITSSLTAFVAGESTYSPPVVQALLPLFPLAYQRRAGYSIKIHPSFVFANLHYWLFGETHWVRFQTGYPMPLEGWDYFGGPDAP